jgi:hypothetical protein
MEKNFSKIPDSTLNFWVINILLTIFEEIIRPVSLLPSGLFYGISALIFSVLTFFIIFTQIKSQNYKPLNYWLAMIATSILGNSIIKFLCDYLGMNYSFCFIIFLFLLLTTFLIWYFKLRSISFYPINNTKAEIFYWIAIMLSQCLATILYKSPESIFIKIIFLIFIPCFYFVLSQTKYEYLIILYVMPTILIIVGITKLIINSRVFRYWSLFILIQTFSMIIYGFIAKITLEELSIAIGQLGLIKIIN